MDDFVKEWEERKLKIREQLKDYPYSLKDFKHHDQVSFRFIDGVNRKGIIHIIDKMGTDECYRICPSFDIYVEEEDTIYKHIPMVFCYKDV